MVNKQNTGQNKEDDVLNIEIEDKNSKKKANANAVSEKKAPAKRKNTGSTHGHVNESPLAVQRKTPPATQSRAEGSSTQNEGGENNETILTILKSIQENQKSQDKKIMDLTNRVSEISDNYDYENNNYNDYYDEDYDNDDPNIDDNDNNTNQEEPPAKKQKTDSNDTDNDEKNSKFSSMSKRSKVKDICGDKIDEVLAKNVNNLFLNGMDEEQYNEIVKDEKTPRPENCEALRVVKTNQLVWDVLPTFTQTCDRKLQNIEKTVVKAATILTASVNKMAQSDNCDDEILDKCNDTIALMGHANRQLNLARREFMKPDLDYNYVHLCAQSVPYTSFLFGDDVSKAAKDIEDTRKIGNRLGGSYTRPFIRGGRGRGPRGRGFRGGFRGASRGGFRGNGYKVTGDYPKNLKRGGSASTSGRGQRH